MRDGGQMTGRRKDRTKRYPLERHCSRAPRRQRLRAEGFMSPLRWAGRTLLLQEVQPAGVAEAQQPVQWLRERHDQDPDTAPAI